MSRQFTFRFESILRLRRQRENEQKRAVAARLREIHRLEDRRVLLLERIDDQAELTRRTLCGEDLDVDRLKLGRHWLVRLRRGLLEAVAELATHRALLAQERTNLAEAAKQSRVLDRLRERRWDAHVRESNRQEQKDLDEMNTIRFVRSASRSEDDVA